jgi:DNA invertase Pin-like site-specific DNA recombinase
MSSEPQDCSVPFQQEWNRTFADKHGMQIITTYVDEARSGVTIRHRHQFKRMLEDVRCERPQWKAILCYDVTRWGRFQDSDEAGFYEWICKMAGCPVIFTAEPFTGGQGPLHAVMKGLKRKMAGDFSRDLSVKTAAGLRYVASQGFWCCGSPPYGYRRAEVDPAGRVVRRLKPGEWTSHNRRTRLVFGPRSEVQIVRDIFRMFVEGRLSKTRIADTLNESGIPLPLGRPWRHSFVNALLRNERYVGNAIFGRRVNKLGSKTTRRSPDQWVNMAGACPAIVEKEVFAAAQWLLDRPRERLSEEELLRRVSALSGAGQCAAGQLTDEPGGRSSPSISKRSMKRISALVGREPPKRRIDLEAQLAALRQGAALGQALERHLVRMGAKIFRARNTRRRLIVNDRVVLGFCATRMWPSEGRSPRWGIAWPQGDPPPDLTVFARLTPDGEQPLDYYFVPASAFAGKHCACITLMKDSALMSAFRCADFSDLAWRVGLPVPTPEDELDEG